MSFDIATAPIDELNTDLIACMEDVAVCRKAIQFGVTHHGDGYPVKDRLDVNLQIAEAITQEKLRRSKAVGNERANDLIREISALMKT